MLTVDHGADGIAEVARTRASGRPSGPRPARPGAPRLHKRRLGRGPRPRRLGAGGANRLGSRLAGQARGRPPHCAPGRLKWSRSDGLGASPPLAFHRLRRWNLCQLRPVIDGQDARRGRRLVVVSGLACHAQQRVRADRHRQPTGQALAGFAAKRQSQAALQAAQALGPPSGERCNTGQALSEGLAEAGRTKATEPPRLDQQRHWTALLRQIAQEPLVVAVDATRDRAAAGARGRRGLRLGDDGDALGGGQDRHNGQARRDQGQKALGQTWLSERIYVPPMRASKPVTTARDLREIQNTGATDTRHRGQLRDGPRVGPALRSAVRQRAEAAQAQTGRQMASQ